MMSQMGWIADVVLAVLLVGTLAMVARLDRALRVVRRDRAAFETLISHLGAATHSVKVGIQALRNEAERAGEQIARRTEEADKMATDLSFLIDAADRAGARLEQRVPPSGFDSETTLPASEPPETSEARPRRRRIVFKKAYAKPAPDFLAPSLPDSPPPDSPPEDLRASAGMTTRRRVRAAAPAQDDSAEAARARRTAAWLVPQETQEAARAAAKPVPQRQPRAAVAMRG
jgi:hypothetical protein